MITFAVVAAAAVLTIALSSRARESAMVYTVALLSIAVLLGVYAIEALGVVSPTMPTFMKVVYIFQMWAGRLEFMSLFALAGYWVALFRGR